VFGWWARESEEEKERGGEYKGLLGGP